MTDKVQVQITIYDAGLFVVSLLVGFGIGYFWATRWLWFLIGFFLGTYAVAKIYNLTSDHILRQFWRPKVKPLDGLDQAEE